MGVGARTNGSTASHLESGSGSGLILTSDLAWRPTAGVVSAGADSGETRWALSGLTQPLFGVFGHQITQ
jgi:hypothetical protein